MNNERKPLPPKKVTAIINEISKIGRPRKRWTGEVKDFPKIT